MKITSSTLLKNGNIQFTTSDGQFEIAKDADHGQPYGICLPGNDTFSPLNKGKGKKAYDSLIKEINKNYTFPIQSQYNTAI